MLVRYKGEGKADEMKDDAKDAAKNVQVCLGAGPDFNRNNSSDRWFFPRSCTAIQK